MRHRDRKLEDRFAEAFGQALAAHRHFDRNVAVVPA